MERERESLNESRRRGRRGQVIILTTLSLFAMCGMMGLAVDLGWSYFVRKSAQAAADGAALAAVQAALKATGLKGPVVCGVGVTCQPTPTPCPASVASPPSDNLNAGCLYAKANGFLTGGVQGRQNVLISADTSSPPPTVLGVNVYYWTTVRVSQSIPQLFSALLGNSQGLSSARATAGIVDAVYSGSLYALNRQNDAGTTDKNKNKNFIGVNIGIQGSGSSTPGNPDAYTINAGGGVWMASTANGASGNYAGQAGGSSTLRSAAFINIRGTGTVDNPGNFIPNPANGFGDLPIYGFQDPMGGLGQPPAPTNLTAKPIINGAINGDCNNPPVLTPGSYYAIGQEGNSNNWVATGQPITVTGCVIFSSGTGAFGNYVFFGGLSFPSPQTVVTFQPGMYVVAGSLQGNPVFYQHTGVTLQDKTPLDSNGQSQANTDAGELFVFTDANYPGLPVPKDVTRIQDRLQFGPVQIQMGNNDGSSVNLHGLNKFSDDLPIALKPFAPAVFWQDQRNSQVKYDANGNVDTSCGSLDSPCYNGDNSISPKMSLQASPNLHLYGLIYQPRGAWMTFQGGGNMEAPLQIVTGFLQMTGNPNITLQRLSNPLTRRVAALIE